MQTQAQIRQMLEDEGLSPRKCFGQNFLIDGNLLLRLSDLAGLDGDGGDVPVLEVGPGTGTLTEVLLERALRVVSVEIDHGMCRLLRKRLGDRSNWTLIEGDALAGKHAVAPAVLSAVAPQACLVANLPYNIATPLIVECLLETYRAQHDRGVRFDRLTFTVQRELADRLSAGTTDNQYGIASVIVALLGRVQLGPVIPPEAFWPRPQVTSRMMRIDFDPSAAEDLRNADVLQKVLATAFGQRRKQIASAAKGRGCPFDAADFHDALKAVGIDPAQRAETVAPEQFRALANALAG